MPTHKSEIEDRARQIAMQVSQRRRSGEILPDEQVLHEFPDLTEPLRKQLMKLRMVEAARQQADLQQINLQQNDASQTLDLPPEDEAAPPPVPGNFQPEVHDSTDELRITLKEQQQEANYQTTMVVADGSVSDSNSTVVPATPVYRPSVRAPMGVIKFFHDGTTSYTPYPVLTERYRIGRVDGDLIVPHDFWMSGRHAEIQRRKRGDVYHWYLVDLNSTNGTFVQADLATLNHNDELFLGQERYRFTNQKGRAGLMHVTTGAGQQWWFSGSAALIGRQAPCGLSSFTSDPYLCPVHAKLLRDGRGNWTIQDNNSRNGVWYRVRGEVELPPNCEFQLGEQRFGFWCFADHPVVGTDLHLASKSE